MTPTTSTRQPRDLRVAVVSKSDRSGGGASKCAELLVLGLQRQKVKADLLTVHPHPSREESWIKPLLPERVRWLNAKAQKATRHILGTEAIPVEAIWLRRAIANYDIVHYYDTWWSVSPWTISNLASRKAVALTIQDCHEFTGGCMYPYSCERFELGCGNCPQADSLFRWGDNSARSFSHRSRQSRSREKKLLAPSRWIADLANRSTVFSEAATVIPNCVDTDFFNPQARTRARVDEQSPNRPFRVLLSSFDLKDKRKGVDLAIDGVNALIRRLAPSGITKPEVLLLGRNGESIAVLLECPTRCLGFRNSDAEIADAYAQADVFLFPSLTDNCPLAVLESQACGTPVIALRRGGVPELIDHNIDGLLVDESEPEAIADALQRLIEGDDLLQFGPSASAKILRQYNLDHGAQAHIRIYEQLLANRHTVSTAP